MALRRRRRIGQAARERVRAGGKLAVGRESETLEGWRRVVAAVRARANDRCEVHGYHPGVDPHHVKYRSRGGKDHPDNVIWICRFAHEMVTAAYQKGRLEVTALGGGKFSWQIVRKENKWATT